MRAYSAYDEHTGYGNHQSDRMELDVAVWMVKPCAVGRVTSASGPCRFGDLNLFSALVTDRFICKLVMSGFGPLQMNRRVKVANQSGRRKPLLPT